MSKDIYAIVLHWNNYIDAKDCIYSLLKCPELDEIILVDNASSDGSLEKLEEKFIKEKKISFLSNNANLGFAKGINVGIRHVLETEAKYILLVNQDTVAGYKFIEECRKVMRNNPDVAVVGPRIYYHNIPDKIWGGGGYFNFLKSGVVIPEKNKYEWQCDNNIKKVTFLTGCALFVRRKVFEIVGFFDEDYFLYEEDVDFALRVCRAGFEMYYVPSAKLWHKISDIAKDRTQPAVMYYLAKNHVIFLRKNFSLLYFLYGFALHLTLFTLFRLYQICTGSRSWKAVWAWFHGIWNGLWHPLHKRVF